MGNQLIAADLRVFSLLLAGTCCSAVASGARPACLAWGGAKLCGST